MVRYGEKCEFTGSSAYNFCPQKQILCVAYTLEESSNKGNLCQLVLFEDFDEPKMVQLDNIVNFATMAKFIIMAEDMEQGLEAPALLDGIEYIPAYFPYNSKAPHPEGYTMLDRQANRPCFHKLLYLVVERIAPGNTQSITLPDLVYLTTGVDKAQSTSLRGSSSERLRPEPTSFGRHFQGPCPAA